MPQVFEEVEMTSNTWISSKEALRRAKAQDATAGDLLEWARQGKLRARADHLSGLLTGADQTNVVQLSEVRA
jgi:hypothetical protein